MPGADALLCMALEICPTWVSPRGSAHEGQPTRISGRSLLPAPNSCSTGKTLMCQDTNFKQTTKMQKPLSCPTTPLMASASSSSKRQSYDTEHLHPQSTEPSLLSQVANQNPCGEESACHLWTRGKERAYAEPPGPPPEALLLCCGLVPEVCRARLCVRSSRIAGSGWSFTIIFLLFPSDA